MLKGQVEFIIILGIIVVAVVAMYYAIPAITTPTAPPAVAAEQEAVKDSVNNFIKGGALETLRTLGTYGGWLEPQPNSVTYLGKDVPYWQYRGTLNIPNFQQNFATSLTDYLKTHKDSLADSLAAKDVTFGEPSVSANILNNQIILNVNMPTTMKGYPVPQPYSITIQTKAGEVFDFANKFARGLGTNRYFEYFTLSSMMLTEIDNGVRKIPFFILLTECGESVFKTWDDVQPEVMNAIKNTLGHTYLPGKTPLNVGQTTGYPKYVVPGVDGRTYSDIDVSFNLPDRFELTEDNFQMDPEPLMLYSELLGFTGICVSDPLYIHYYLTYPVVAEVRDPLTGNVFRFAFEVIIKDNEPADYGVTGYAVSIPTFCDDPACIANVRVVDSSGASVPGARIDFMGCTYKADSDGMFQGLIPCGMGAVTAYASGFGELSQITSSTDLYDTTLTLKRKPVVNLYFHEVIVNNDSINERYMIFPYDIRWINNEQRPEEIVVLSFADFDTGENIVRMYTTRSATLKEVSPAEYAFGASLFKEDMSVKYGASLTMLDLRENTANLHFYIPYLSTYPQDERDLEAGLILTNVLKQCGIPVASPTPIALTETCFLNHEEVSLEI